MYLTAVYPPQTHKYFHSRSALGYRLVSKEFILSRETKRFLHIIICVIIYVTPQSTLAFHSDLITKFIIFAISLQNSYIDCSVTILNVTDKFGLWVSRNQNKKLYSPFMDEPEVFQLSTFRKSFHRILLRFE